jgi:hypothetical protein
MTKCTRIIPQVVGGPALQVQSPELKLQSQTGCQWLVPVILATQEAEIRIEVQSQPRQTVCKRHYLEKKKPSQKMG